MGAVPKKKVSRRRRGMRRSHDRLPLPSLSTCPVCGRAKLPHRVCPHCGTYHGRQILPPDEVEIKPGAAERRA